MKPRHSTPADGARKRRAKTATGSANLISSQPLRQSPRAASFDILDAVVISLPCARCGQHYQVTLRQVTVSQEMMHQGCPVPYATECPPLSQARLFRPGMVRGFQAAWERLERRAAKMGGTLGLQCQSKLTKAA